MHKMIKILKRAKKIGFCSAVIVAAGSSTRFGEDKLMAALFGKTVLEHSLLAFENCERVDEIILVTKTEALEETAGYCAGLGLKKLKGVVCGGAERVHSALAGVSETDRRAGMILIHDAARPLVTGDAIEKMIDAIEEGRVAACPAISARDTIRETKNGKTRTLTRAELCAVQTPQAFDADIIKAALTRAVRSGETHTDDCAAAEAMGVPIFIVSGDEENIKITTATDLSVAKAILEQRRMRN